MNSRKNTRRASRRRAERRNTRRNNMLGGFFENIAKAFTNAVNSGPAMPNSGANATVGGKRRKASRKANRKNRKGSR